MDDLVDAMQNLILIRNPGLTGMALVISLLAGLTDTSIASLNGKPNLSQGASQRAAKAKTTSHGTAKPKIFASLFGKSRSSSSAASLPGFRQMTRTVRTTAYTHEEAGHQAYGRSTAIGTLLRCSRSYTSAAADWSRFPLGTKFQIVGDPTVYVIDDCGGALYGTDTIDIYRPSLAAMHAWGTRHVQIKILDLAKRRPSPQRS
jgi:3D (Asp-Asp-Asp) domain-containing protein